MAAINPVLLGVSLAAAFIMLAETANLNLNNGAGK